MKLLGHFNRTWNKSNFFFHSKLLFISKTCFSYETFTISTRREMKRYKCGICNKWYIKLSFHFWLCKYLGACWHANKTDLSTLHIKTDLPILHIKSYFCLFSNILTLIFFRYSFNNKKNISKGFLFCKILLSSLN